MATERNPGLSEVRTGHIPYNTLGYVNHDWLQARHHFSFASYRNPERMGFGSLLVVNDDTIAPHKGFGLHPHDNMEIITYVRQGAISHKDNMGNQGRTAAGDVQVMSAGRGVMHSEHNLENVPTTLYQIWIIPHTTNVEPRWEARTFPKEPCSGHLKVLVSGQAIHKGSDALLIHADAAIYGGKLNAGAKITQSIQHQAYILASKGSFIIEGITLNEGDAAELVGHPTLHIEALANAEVLVLDVPA